MTAEPGIILDVSRLVSRLGAGPLTGIDRVEAEWLRHLQTRPHLLTCRGWRGQVLLLPPQAGAALLGWVEGRADGLAPRARLSDRLRGRDAVRSRALAALQAMALQVSGSAGRGIAATARATLRGAAPVWLNVGHANLSPRLLSGLGDMARVALIHDTIPLDHPEFTREGQQSVFRDRLRAVLMHADLVLTVSESAARDVARWRDTLAIARRAPIVATPIGTRIAAPDPSALPADLDRSRPLFLAIGTIEPRKNHALLLDCWALLARRMAAEDMPLLVIAGRRGWRNAPVFERLDALGPQDMVRELTGLDDGAISALMARTRALLMPSRAEGFGLPLTEAAAQGIPVLAAPLPATAELLGDYASYLDPDDPAAWADAVTGMAQHPLRRQPPLAVPDWDGHFRSVTRLLAGILPSAAA